MSFQTKLHRAHLAPLALALAGLILILPLRAGRQLADSMGFVANIQSGSELFHPHHILFAPIIWCLHHLLKTLHLSSSAILAGQLHNAAWAVVGLVALFSLTRRLTGSAAQAAAAALALLLLSGYWTYASLVEPYVPATACALALLPILLRAQEGPLPLRSRLAALFFFTLMIAYQQPNVLFCAPLLVFAASLRRRRLFLDALLLIALSGVILLVIYLAAYFFYYKLGSQRPFIPGFPRFCLTYASNYNPDWGTTSHFSPRGLNNLLFSQTTTIFQVEKFAGLKKLFSLLTGAGILILSAWNAVQLRRAPAMSSFRLLLLTWLGLYLAFYLWWLPTEREFFIITLVPLLLLALLAFNDLFAWVSSPLPQLRSFAWVAFIPLLFGLADFNYKHAIRLNRVPPNDIYYQEAARLHRVAAPADTLLTNFVTRGYLSCYFDNAQNLDIESAYHSAMNQGVLPKWVELDKVPQYLFALKSLHRDNAKSPERLKLYQTALLGLRYDAAGRLASHRAFQALCAEGAVYLRVLPDRLPVSGEQEFKARLDQALQNPALAR